MTWLHLCVSQLPRGGPWRAWVSGRAEGNGKGQLQTQRLCFPFICPAQKCFVLTAPSRPDLGPDGLGCACARVLTHRCADALHLDSPQQWPHVGVGRVLSPAPRPGLQRCLLHRASGLAPSPTQMCCVTFARVAPSLAPSGCRGHEMVFVSPGFGLQQGKCCSM